MNLLSMGLATTPAFRRKFMALNRVLDKRARYWRTDIFRQDFWRGKHYRLRIGGKVKRFAVPWVFPVDYLLLGDQKTQLLDMAISPSGAERFRKVLESKCTGHICLYQSGRANALSPGVWPGKCDANVTWRQPAQDSPVGLSLILEHNPV